MPRHDESVPEVLPARAKRRRWLLVLTALLAMLLLWGGGGLLAVLGVAWAVGRGLPDAPGYQEKDASIRVSRTSFNSGGKTIAVEQFAPARPGKYPAVLVVHGADGLQLEVWRKVYRGHAQELARHGYVALLVHYFDRTGSTYGDERTNREHFTTWLATLGEAVTFALSRPEVGGRRVGLVGVSLGSYLSMSLAAYDERIGAVVEVFGGIPPQVSATLRRLPPTLVLHGDADRIVPVSEARKLEKLLREKDVPHEVHIYPGQGHGFTGEPARDALRRGVSFLDRHVKENEAGDR